MNIFSLKNFVFPKKLKGHSLSYSNSWCRSESQYNMLSQNTHHTQKNVSLTCIYPNTLSVSVFAAWIRTQGKAYYL